MRWFHRSGGSGHRLEDWLDEHYAGVYRTARLILLSPEAAEEAAGQAFLRAWQFRAAAPSDEGVRLWLLRAVVHSCARQLRAATDGERPRPGDALVSALAALPADERIVAVLRFWAGLSPLEAARVLGERPQRVTARLEAAMAHLAGDPLAVAAGGARS